jgi:hypothetical protein
MLTLKIEFCPEPDTPFNNVRVIQVGKSLDKVQPHQLEDIGDPKTGFHIGLVTKGKRLGPAVG